MRAKAVFKAGLLECPDCHQLVARRAAVQKYCTDCSSARDTEGKRLWSQKHTQTPNPMTRAARASIMVEEGVQRSLENRVDIMWTADATDEEVSHAVRLAVPFDWAASKNAIWRMGRGGHIYARQEANAYRENIAERIRLSGGTWFDGKIWIDIFVEKPSHHGDAINVVDLVCDAVKDGTGVDDRWYSIKRLDWAIVKENPRLFIGVSQSVTEAHRICSHCGRALALASNFGNNKSMPGGFGRVCLECSRLKHRRRSVA